MANRKPESVREPIAKPSTAQAAYWESKLRECGLGMERGRAVRVSTKDRRRRLFYTDNSESVAAATGATAVPEVEGMNEAIAEVYTSQVGAPARPVKAAHNF